MDICFCQVAKNSCFCISDGQGVGEDKVADLLGSFLHKGTDGNNFCFNFLLIGFFLR
jgi:hypothetical protein